LEIKADGAADEIDNLKKEAAAFREVRANIGDADGPRKMFDKVRFPSE
jgi:ubiquitin-like 1-activating enzyme E1 B